MNLQNQVQGLEKSRAEQENQLKNLREELTFKNHQMKSLEVSNTKYRKLQQVLATKVFLSDFSNEDLDTLLNLNIEKLFEKYEQTMQAKTLDNVKLEETIETLNDVKTKLKLQMEQRELYEKQHGEMMEVLNISSE